MTAPTRAALSRELIAKTALALTDEAGLTGLSMRKLGNELGVEAMSLYHYVENKDDLLDAVLDTLYAEVELPFDVPEQDWELAIRRGLHSFHDVLTRHPAAVELFSSRPTRSDAGLRLLLFCHQRFNAVGLDVAQSVQALHFGVSFVLGHVANELGATALIEAGDGIDLDTIADPHLASFMRERRAITTDEMFAAGLEAVVAGLRATFNLP